MLNIGRARTVRFGNGGGLRLGTGGGSPPDSSVALRAHLTPAAKAAAEAMEAEFTANAWSPNLATVVWDDTVQIADGGELFRWLRNNLSIGGVVLNPARNQRIQLAAGGDFSYGAPNQTGGGTAGICDIRGRDYLSNGKMLLIEPATTSPQITQAMSIAGCTGIYIRGLDFFAGVDDFGGDWANYAPFSLHTLTVTAGGTGYTTGEPLVFTGTYDEAPVGTIIASGGVVTGVNITYGGKAARSPSTGSSLISTVSVTSTGSGATFTVPGQQTNPRDTAMIRITRNATFPLLPVVIMEGNRFGKGFIDANPQKYGGIIQASNLRQLTFVNNKVKGYQTALNVTTCRLLKVSGNDDQLGMGDFCIALNTQTTLAIAGGQSFDTVFPDKIVYSWVRLNTKRNLLDDCARVNAQGEDLRFDQEHTDFFQNGTLTDTGPYKTLFEFNAGYSERETYQNRNSAFRNNSAPTVRVAGGTQGVYQDDTPNTFSLDTVQHSNIIAVNTSNAFTAYQGTSYIERNTGVRVGRQTPSATTVPDGFNYSTDANVDITLGKKDAGAVATIHVTGNLTGGVSTYAPPRDVTVATNVDNLNCNPRLTASPGDAYSDRFVGTFTTINGLTGYSFTDDGAASQAAFRAALWAQFAPKGAAVGKGAPDPSLWPAA